MQNQEVTKLINHFIEQRIERLTGEYEEMGVVRQANISQLLLLGHIITKSFGTGEQEVELKRYKEVGLLSELEIKQEVTQEQIYGAIKYYEYLETYLQIGGRVTGLDQQQYSSVVELIIENLSLIFNNWEEYKDKINRELVTNRPIEVIEYEFEDGLSEEQQPQTRAERRELERKKRLNKK